MAVTYTHLTVGHKNTSGTSYTTASFTPTAGRRLIVVAGCMTFGTGVDPSGSLTISDSQGGLTWTKIGDAGNATAWAIGMAAWISSAAAASSMTVTVGTGATTMFDFAADVAEVDGSSGATAGYVENGNTTFNGSYTVTLAATPSTDDVCFFARMIDWDFGTLSMGSGWSVIGQTENSSGGGVFGVAANDNLGSATVSIADAHVPNGSGDASGTKAIDFAFIVKAASSGTTIATGRADETDTATARTASKARATGRADETDTATARTASKARATGRADETDTAAALTASKARATGRADETDTAAALTASKARACGRADESGAAFALAASKARALGRADETDTAFDLAATRGLSVGRAGETDVAFALAPSKSRACGRAVETDAAFALLLEGATTYATERLHVHVIPLVELAHVHVIPLAERLHAKVI